MKPNQPSDKEIKALVGEPGPEDGIDPRDQLRGAGSKKGGRKTLQLCSQVERALNYALSSVCNDDVLREMGVVVVRPAPDEGRLLVVIGPLLKGDHDPAVILARLHQHAGQLRREVANTIHRRKVPDLTYQVAITQG